MAELGNLSAGILLSLERMSTVKIRAGSLFRTPLSRIGAGKAGSGPGRPVENPSASRARCQNAALERVFLRPPQDLSPLHRLYTGTAGFALAGSQCPGAKSEDRISRG